MQGVAQATAPLQMFVPLALTALGTIASMTTMMALKGTGANPTSILGSLKAKTGLLPWAAGLAGLLSTAKDMDDVINGSRKKEDMGGIGGGVVGGTIGFALGGPIGMGIGAMLGNVVGGYIGHASDENTSHATRTNELLKEMHGQDGKTQEDTEQIRRIQQDQERRARTLSNPQISILTTINDTLVRNLAVLERTAGQTRRQTELIEDSKFDNATMKAPMLSRAIGGT